jgi:hypothetical protein
MRRSSLCTALLLGGALLPAPPLPADRGDDLEQLFGRVAAYVERFHREMEGAVLEEKYVQVLKRPCCSEPRNPGSSPWLAWRDEAPAEPDKGVEQRRQLLSEVLLVPATGGMMVGYRDVFEVDGREVRARDERMRRLFERGTADGRVELGRILAESARFNIGPTRRSGNVPSFPLLYLSAAMRPNLYLSGGGRDRRDGRDLVVLEFREDGTPTLTSTAEGRDVPARGRAWIEPESGAVREIELRLGEGARRLLRVWFRDEPRLGVLVPVRMWEWFERIPIPGETWPADLETQASYTGLKLFTVTTEEVETKAQ